MKLLVKWNDDEIGTYEQYKIFTDPFSKILMVSFYDDDGLEKTQTASDVYVEDDHLVVVL